MQSLALRKGLILGKYRLDGRLGRGAFASVWKARDTVENRDVALKVIDPRVEEEYSRAEVEREARIATRLNHPNVVAVRNADWVDGRFVMATALADRSLAAWPGARRSARVALQVVRDVAAGLAYAHSQKVMHLDLKPENIMIFNGGRAAIGDFGTSRLVGGANLTYTEAGTLGYVAPEQAYGRARPASDVFSLGLIAYELLTGKLLKWPFEWPPDRHDRFERKVPERLRTVLRKAAAFEPRRRYVDGMALSRDLEAFFRREEDRPATPPRPPHRRPPRSPLSIESSLFRRRFGAALGMRYDCHHCDGPIAEAMAHCPWCGCDDISFREVTSYPLVCPDCERGVLPEWTACPWCYPGRFAGNGHPPRDDPRAVRRCSRRGCSGQLRPFMRYCPVCKQKPRRPWSHESLGERCPRCRWPVSRDSWRFCPWCGRREPAAGTFRGSRSG